MQEPVWPAPSKAPVPYSCTSSPSNTHSSQQTLLGVMALELCSSSPLRLVLSTPHSSCSSFYNHLEHYSHRLWLRCPFWGLQKRSVNHDRSKMMDDLFIRNFPCLYFLVFNCFVVAVLVCFSPCILFKTMFTLMLWITYRSHCALSDASQLKRAIQNL